MMRRCSESTIRQVVVTAVVGVSTMMIAACAGDGRSSNLTGPTSTAAVVAVALNGGPSPMSSTFQLIATATMADGTAQDVTRSATWLSSDSQLATISSTGYVTIVGSGDVDLHATYQGVIGSMRATVAIPILLTIGGVVTEATSNGHPIAGARIQAIIGAHAVSDQNGVFALAVPGGRTILEISKDGYQSMTQEVDVNRDMQLAFALTPAPAQAGN